ncbi:MAG: DUF2892 domain-containing protein [Flavobacterium sp.]|nr:MAG: DUF2892 domain-containing protein [Flavobacterium sp.]
MQKNLNRKDGIIRTILGIGCFVIFFKELFDDALIEMIFVIIGSILLISAFAEFCPLYYVLGIKTRRKRKQKFY